MPREQKTRKTGSGSSVEVSSMGRRRSKYAKKGVLPFIKGPSIDYTYVVGEEEFRDGETIVTEWEHGSWIWVILDGKVKIMKETPKGKRAVALLGQGCFIGTFTSLLLRECARSATATAVDNVYLGLLDTLRLSGEYSSLSYDFRRLLISLAGRLTKITDRALDAPLEKRSADNLPGDKELIMERGSSKKEIFTITEGESYVIGQTSKGDLPLLMLHKDDVFGYVPFVDMNHEPRCASVFGSKDLKLHRLDKDSLCKEYAQLSGVFRNLIDNVGNCISVTTRKACFLH
jgi:hypothetical protein